MCRFFCWVCCGDGDDYGRSGVGLGGRRLADRAQAREHVSLGAISCPSASRCCAVGSTSGVIDDLGQRPVMELWKGHRWTVVTLPSRPVGSFTDVSCASARFCMAVGDHRRAERTGLYDSPIAQRWNGRKWKNQPMVRVPRDKDLVETSVSCTSSTACVAVGAGFAQRWNGHDWRSVRSPIAPPGQLSCVDARSSRACRRASDLPLPGLSGRSQRVVAGRAGCEADKVCARLHRLSKAHAAAHCRSD